MASGEVSAGLYVTSGFHLYMYYSFLWKKGPREAFEMEAVKAPPSFVSVGHGCVQHTGSELRCKHCARYYS